MSAPREPLPSTRLARTPPRPSDDPDPPANELLPRPARKGTPTKWTLRSLQHWVELTFGRTYCRGCLLDLVGTRFPKIGDQESAVCPFECDLEGFGVIEIRFDNFVGKPAVFAWIARQSAYLELALGLQGAHDCASLLPRCADDRDQLFLTR